MNRVNDQIQLNWKLPDTDDLVEEIDVLLISETEQSRSFWVSPTRNHYKISLPQLNATYTISVRMKNACGWSNPVDLSYPSGRAKWSAVQDLLDPEKQNETPTTRNLKNIRGRNTEAYEEEYHDTYVYDSNTNGNVEGGSWETTPGEPNEGADQGEMNWSTDWGESNEGTNQGELNWPTDQGELNWPTDQGESNEGTDRGEMNWPTDQGEPNEGNDQGNPNMSTNEGESNESTDQGELYEGADQGNPNEKEQEKERAELLET
ncbi:unnamed protein product [Echinostoma caproni]|uniref:Fibronectin type-III domain-containing protein n=1 Tax=Echinostoma caproni TaxID=27848 RepID=A0A183ACZ7_9TREM|nr:unnamed protein product [Echinostoma caproni]